MNNNDIHAIADNYSDNSHCFGTSHQNAIADKANLKIFTQLKKDSENYKTASMLLSAYRIADDIEKAKLQENIIQALDRFNVECDKSFPEQLAIDSLFQNAILKVYGNRKILVLHHGFRFLLKGDNTVIETAFGTFLLSDYDGLKALVEDINSSAPLGGHEFMKFRPSDEDMLQVIIKAKDKSGKLIFIDTTVVHGHDGPCNLDMLKQAVSNTKHRIVAINSRTDDLEIKHAACFVPF